MNVKTSPHMKNFLNIKKALLSSKWKNRHSLIFIAVKFGPQDLNLSSICSLLFFPRGQNPFRLWALVISGWGSWWGVKVRYCVSSIVPRCPNTSPRGVIVEWEVTSYFMRRAAKSLLLCFWGIQWWLAFFQLLHNESNHGETSGYYEKILERMSIQIKKFEIQIWIQINQTKKFFERCTNVNN